MTTENNTEAKPAPEPKVVMPTQNDVTRPRPGTTIARIWDTCDDLSKTLERPCTRGEAKAAVDASINPATFATQYARWTKFYGIGAQLKDARKAATEAKKEEAKAAGETKRLQRAAERQEKAEKAAKDKAEKQAADKKAKEEKAAADKAAADAKAAETKAAADKAAAETKPKGKGKGKTAEQAPAAA